MPKESLIQSLIDDGYLKTPAIIEAFRKIDRANFVPEEQKDEAYGNYPLPIGFGQTISQPLTVAFMLELLEPKSGEKILDVGTGSGWQAALLAHIVGDEGKVIAVERIAELFMFAGKNLGKYDFLGKGTIKIINADGSGGYKVEAPFDKIIAAASAEKIPEAWKEQLKIGGRIVAPVKESILVLDKKGPGEFEGRRYFGFSFVPLIIGNQS
ncbi:MAG: protein-L-isoaspartate(D-aspartate) O-methyltransferase [Minisyncoccia bacterium]